MSEVLRRRQAGSTTRRAAGLLALGLLAGACGVRTGPPDEDTAGSGPTGDDPREGGCDIPFVLPFANIEVRGRLQGPSRVNGWCDVDGNGGGGEDTYLITPPVTTDVLVFVLPDTEFDATLRVTRDGCYHDDANVPRICAAPIGDSVPYRHFLAEAGHSYSLTIDSPEDTDGLYTMQVFYGQPGLEACPIHPSQINQEPGGYFTWSNSFTGRQGLVDGLCGGPGAENMFQINVVYPGNIRFRVSADDSFAPVLSVRTGCGATTELACTSMELEGSATFELNWFFTPGTYYIVVDQDDVRGGKYELEAFID